MENLKPWKTCINKTRENQKGRKNTIHTGKVGNSFGKRKNPCSAKQAENTNNNTNNTPAKSYVENYCSRKVKKSLWYFGLGSNRFRTEVKPQYKAWMMQFNRVPPPDNEAPSNNMAVEQIGQGLRTRCTITMQDIQIPCGGQQINNRGGMPSGGIVTRLGPWSSVRCRQAGRVEAAAAGAAKCDHSYGGESLPAKNSWKKGSHLPASFRAGVQIQIYEALQVVQSAQAFHSAGRTAASMIRMKATGIGNRRPGTHTRWRARQAARAHKLMQNSVDSFLSNA